MKYLKTFENKEEYNIINGKLIINNLNFRGDLDLENTTITELPNNLTVGGSIYLNDTPIKKLPDDLIVNGYLNLYNTPLERRYNKLDIRKKCNIKGKIYPLNLNGSEKKYQRWLIEQETEKYNL